MKKELPGAGFAAALMLTLVLVAWLGLWGPFDLAKFEKWQPLITALVAVGGVWVALRNVRSTMWLTVLTREEDRVERELPGIVESLAFIDSLRNILAEGPDESTLDAILEYVGAEEGRRNYFAEIEKALPQTRHSTRQDIEANVRLLLVDFPLMRIGDGSIDAARFEQVRRTVEHRLVEAAAPLREMRDELLTRRTKLRSKINRIIDRDFL